MSRIRPQKHHAIKKIKIKRSCYVPGLFFVVSLTAVTIRPSDQVKERGLSKPDI